MVDYEKSWVVEYLDATSQPFLRDKLLLSLHRSLQHRPTALSDALGLSNTVISRLLPVARNGQLATSVVATVSLETLRNFDKAAAVSYQAFHQDLLA